jgi:anthranilate phosphoribosyltransferase
MIKEAIVKLSKKENLTYQEAETVMDEIMSGQATAVQMSSYLTALSMKGETIDEITASAAGMRAHCIKLLHDLDVLEIVGTGGDGANSFNISTTSSLVIAAGGVPVAKHGNRAASSKSGAADVLEALGVNITIPPEKSAELLKKINICFLFAQNYHIAMKYVAPIRKELGIRTVFNILGPLSNPAGANMELMGVFDQALVEPLAQVMAKLGVTKGMVVFGQDKLDEISMSAPTSVCEIKDGWFQSYEITPEQFGYERCSKDDLAGGTPAENAEITKAILRGELKPGERLMEIQLANKLGVSRTPIREAIRKLELEGLVLMIPRKGAEVAQITEKNMQDVLEVRKALEELSVQLACERITPEQVEEMKMAAEDFRKVLKSGDVTKIAEADVKFHDIIFAATNNQRLITLLNNLREQMYRFRVEYLKQKECYPQLLEEHDKLIALISGGEVEEACELMGCHIDNQASTVSDVIRRDQVEYHR